MNADDFIPVMLEICRGAEDRDDAVRDIENRIPEGWQAEALSILDQFLEGTPFQIA